MSKITSASDDLLNADAGIEEDAPYTPSAVQRIVYWLKSPYLTLISRLALGGIMLIAGLTKLGVPATMKQSILAYEIPLPGFLVEVMSTALPILEVGLGIWLLIGLFTRLSAAISIGLMAVFTIAITQAWLRGLNIDCGCFGGAEVNSLGAALVGLLGPVGDYLAHEVAGPETIIRDIVLLLMGVHLFFVPTIFAVDNLRHRTAEE